MKKYGFVASGGGYRSFYTAGALVGLKQSGIPLVHLTSTSSGNNIVLDYLLWDDAHEELPPTLTKTFRLNLRDIFDVMGNFLGLKPSLLPNGSRLFSVNKDRTRQSLLLDEPKRRSLLESHLAALKWDIVATNLSKRRTEYFSVNDILAKVADRNLERFMDVFLAGITTIPYFEAIQMKGDYYLEGGYMDNIPLRTLFEDPEVEEIIVVDFTDYDYHADLDALYHKSSFTLPLNSINMNILVSDIQLSLPSIATLNHAKLINEWLRASGKTAFEVAGKTYHYKPLHILRPKNLKSMTIALGDSRAQKTCFDLGQKEVRALL